MSEHENQVEGKKVPLIAVIAIVIVAVLALSSIIRPILGGVGGANSFRQSAWGRCH